MLRKWNTPSLRWDQSQIVTRIWTRYLKTVCLTTLSKHPRETRDWGPVQLVPESSWSTTYCSSCLNSADATSESQSNVTDLIQNVPVLLMALLGQNYNKSLFTIVIGISRISPELHWAMIQTIPVISSVSCCPAMQYFFLYRWYAGLLYPITIVYSIILAEVNENSLLASVPWMLWRHGPSTLSTDVLLARFPLLDKLC